MLEGAGLLPVAQVADVAVHGEVEVGVVVLHGVVEVGGSHPDAQLLADLAPAGVEGGLALADLAARQLPAAGERPDAPAPAGQDPVPADDDRGSHVHGLELRHENPRPSRGRPDAPAPS